MDGALGLMSWCISTPARGDILVLRLGLLGEGLAHRPRQGRHDDGPGQPLTTVFHVHSPFQETPKATGFRLAGECSCSNITSLSGVNFAHEVAPLESASPPRISEGRRNGYPQPCPPRSVTVRT